MQIKRTMRYYLTPIRRAIIPKEEVTNAGKHVDKICTLLAGMSVGAATMDNSKEGPPKSKNRPNK